jgi:hypothetical protein
MTSEKAIIFRQELSLTCLAALNTAAVVGGPTQQARTSFGEE